MPFRHGRKKRWAWYPLTCSSLLAPALIFAFVQGTALEGQPHLIALLLIVLPEDILEKAEESVFSSVVIKHPVALVLSSSCPCERARSDLAPDR